MSRLINTTEETGGVCGPAAAAVCLAALLCGCSDSIREYTSLKRLLPESEKPLVLSGNPERDGRAAAAAGEELSEADWRVLEKIAPRSIWRRIMEAQAAAKNRAADSPDVQDSAAAPRPTECGESMDDVPIIEQADGDIRILYRLRHYGGVDVQSSRDGSSNRRSVKTTKVDLKPLVQLVAERLGKEGTVSALAGDNMLVITCPLALKEGVLALLAGLDKAKRQVEITARIFEVSHDFDFQYGANAVIKHLSNTEGQALASGFNAHSFAGAIVDPLNGTVPNPGSALGLIQAFEGAGLRFEAVFQALVETGLVKVVSSPRMTVASGQTAYMMAGQELPIHEGRIANDQLVTQKIIYKPIGVQLHITPQTIGPDSVKLHVLTVVSAISGFAPLATLNEHEPAATIINPILDSREAETFVDVRHGNTLVVGGMRMVRKVTRESKVPGLGDIDFLGWLFKSHRSQKQITDLYFFVTPRLVQ